MTDSDAHSAIVAAALYWYNREPLDVIDALFPGAHPTYQREQLDRWHVGLSQFFMHLDTDHQRLFVRLALAAYEDEAARRISQ